jgi:hypothetical protein
MRTFELRVYTLRTKEALNFYAQTIYPRHVNSFPVFGIEAHGFWTAKEGCRATALRAGLLCGGRRTRRGRSEVYGKHRIR